MNKKKGENKGIGKPKLDTTKRYAKSGNKIIQKNKTD